MQTRRREWRDHNAPSKKGAFGGKTTREKRSPRTSRLQSRLRRRLGRRHALASSPKPAGSSRGRAARNRNQDLSASGTPADARPLGGISVKRVWSAQLPNDLGRIRGPEANHLPDSWSPRQRL